MGELGAGPLVRWLGTRRMWILVVGLTTLSAALLGAAWLRIEMRAQAEVPVASVAGLPVIAAGEAARYRVQVRDGRRGAPLPGAWVEAFVSNKRDDFARASRSVTATPTRTGPDGVAQIDVVAPPDLSSGRHLLRFVVTGPRNASETSLLVEVGKAASSPRSFVSTDKPSYQPGQTVHLRTLTLLDATGRPAAGWDATLEITDPRGTKIFKREAPLSAQGLLSADFELAEAVLLGDYEVSVRVGDQQGKRRFSVERYALPTFRVRISSDEASYRQSETFRGTVAAEYTFGKPVRGAAVRVALGVGPLPHRLATILKGETDDAGRFRFSASLRGVQLPPLPATLVAEARVTAPNGDEQSKSVAVPIGKGAIDLAIVPERDPLIPGLEQWIYVAARRPDGRPASVRLRLEPGGTAVQTDDRGTAAMTVTPTEGSAKWTVTATDDEGRAAQERFEPSLELVDSALLVRTDRTLYRSGQTIEVEVRCRQPTPGIIRVNLLHDHRVVSYATSEEAAGRWKLSLAIPPQVVGTVPLVAIHDDDDTHFGGRSPEGVRWVQVVRPDDLTVDIAPSQTLFRPAETARLDIRVRTQQGEPVVAALGLAAVDEAVFSRIETRPDLERLFFRAPQLDDDRDPEIDLGPDRWTVEQRSTLLAATPADDLARAALLAAIPAHGTRPDWEGASVAEVRKQIAEDVETGRRLVALAAMSLLLVGYGLLVWLLLVYGWRQLARMRPVDHAIRPERQAHRRAIAAVMRWWVGALYLPGAVLLAALVLLLSLLRWRDDSGVPVALGLFVLTTLGCASGLLRAAVRAGTTALGRATPGLRQVLRALAPACVLGNLGGLALLYGFNSWLWRELPRLHELLGWLAVLVPLALGQLVVGMLSAARHAPIGRPHGGSVRGLLVTRPLFAGLPLTLVAMALALYDGHEDAARFDAAVAEDWLNVPTARGTAWGDDTRPWGRDDSLGSSPGGPTAESARVRHLFPETLLWLPEVVTDERGRARVEVPLADSITTWRLSASAVTGAGQLGATTRGLEVFQDFFVDVSLPVALTQRDEVTVPVALYSYREEPQQVRLKIGEARWFELDGDAVTDLAVGPGQVVRHDLRLRALEPGEHELTLFASTPTVADAVRRSVTVHPDGRPVTQVVNRRLADRARLDVRVPEEAVAGAGRLTLKIYPSSVSTLVAGLEGLIRMPHGCFEQTSSVTYPNALALAYFEQTGRGAPEVVAEARRAVDLGYQRLLTFEVRDGGFSLFGKPPADLVLTAYGLLELIDIARVRDVDPALVSRTRSWLRAQQRADGSWPVGSAIGGAADDEQQQLRKTAYLAWALAEAGDAGGKLEATLAPLAARRAPTCDDAYLAALVANALVAAGRNEVATRWAERLVQLAHQDGDTAYWTAVGPGIFWSQGSAFGTETTALAVQALLRAERGEDTVRAALRWLTSTRDARGTWRSTQATIQALRAVLAQPQVTDQGVRRLSVRMDGELVETAPLEPDQRDVLRLVDLSAHKRLGHQTIELEIDRGFLDVQLVSTHHVPWKSADEKRRAGPLSLAVRYPAGRVRRGAAEWCRVDLRWDRDEPASMVVVEVGRPPGFDPLEWDLEGLKRAGRISHYELQPRQLRLYLERLAKTRPFRAKFRLLARQSGAVQSPPSRAYLYYEPEVEAAALPAALQVR